MLKTKKHKQKKFQKMVHPPDFLYRSAWMAKFCNRFMRDGKKAVTEKIIFHSLKEVKHYSKRRTLSLLLQILLKFRPLMGFISKRFGKQFKKIPVPLYPRRQVIVSVKWLVTAIKLQRASSFHERLKTEFVDLNLGKKTLLSKRLTEHLNEINTNRLHVRFRWK